MSGNTLYWAYILKGFIAVCLIGAGVLLLGLAIYQFCRWLGHKIDGI